MADCCTMTLLLTAIVGVFGLTQAEVEDATVEAAAASEDEASASRVRRDGYGGAYGGGGGGYSGGGGSYGCHCPYQYCDNNSDMLLYFSAGALLGLLFSMLQPQMMMATMGRSGNTPEESEKTGSGFFSNIPNVLSQDIAPLAVDMVNVYAKSQKAPECGRRWLCEVTQTSLKQGGLRARLTSLSSVAVSWFMKDMMPFMENLSDKDEDSFDCALLGPTCRGFFEQKTET